MRKFPRARSTNLGVRLEQNGVLHFVGDQQTHESNLGAHVHKRAAAQTLA